MSIRRCATVAASLGLIAGVIACGHKSPAAPERVDAAAPSPLARGSSTSSGDVALDLIGGFDACSLGYRGTVLDLGEPSSRARLGGKLELAPVETLEREGATWARVRTRSLALSYYAAADELRGDGSDAAEETFVETRIRGLAAKTVAVYLDGKPIGGFSPLPKGEAGLVMVKAPVAAPGEGEHEVLLRFGGAPRSTTDALAEVDWIHIGSGASEANFAAPTRADVLTAVTLGGEPMHALSLRAPGFARCSGWIPKGSRMEAVVSMAPPGEGDAQIRLLRDRAEPLVLGSVHLSPDDKEPRRVSWSVGDFGGDNGALAAIELVAQHASKGARIVFGTPRVVAPADEHVDPGGDPAKKVAARGVILVVLGELSTRSLSLYGGQRPAPELEALARTGVTFEAHRATSQLSGAAFGSMMTGLTARASTLEDASVRLPRSLTTVADAARQAGIAAAFFTADPTTGAAFGFDRGWMTFEATSPNDDVPAVTLFDHGAQWLEAHKAEPFLLVLHARGGHPPWDATPEELKVIAPSGYTGALDAKHAAELLGHSRASGGLHWTDADRERAWALYALALSEHDAAFGRLLRALHAAGRDGDTAIFVTGDVGVNEASHMPFADAEAPDEAALWVPLVARLPSGALSGKRVNVPTEGLDLARTIVETLGLEAPASFGGMNVFDVARGVSPRSGRPMVATGAGRFAVRWDRYVLSGMHDRETKLCDLALEPTCVTDVRPTYPLALDVLHRVTFDALVGGDPPPPHEPATVDAATAAALRAWGK